MTAPTLVYLLCLAASLACAGMLLRSFFQSRSRLLLWAGLGFCAISVNNLALVADMVVWRTLDLWILRQLAAGASVGVLLYGFLWEADR